MKDKTKKSPKRSFGIADTAVLIGSVILAVALVYTALLLVFGGRDVFSLFGKDNGDEVTLSLSLRVSGIDTTVFSVEPQGDDALCDFISVGDTFYIDGEGVGTVTHIGYTDHMVETGLADAQGSLVYAAYPDYLDLIVTVETTGRESEKGFTVSDHEIKVDTELTLSTKKAEFGAVVTAVEIVDVKDMSDVGTRED